MQILDVALFLVVVAATILMLRMVFRFMDRAFPSLGGLVQMMQSVALTGSLILVLRLLQHRELPSVSDLYGVPAAKALVAFVLMLIMMAIMSVTIFPLFNWLDRISRPPPGADAVPPEEVHRRSRDNSWDGLL